MAKIQEDKFIQTDEDKGYGIAVDEYNGTYSLALARKNDKGDVWQEWSFTQMYSDGKHVPADKAYPTRMRLGTKEQAIQRLEQLIMMIEGRDVELDEPF